MTVLPRWRNPEPSYRAFCTRREDPEPKLEELLDDPVLHAVMARDGIDRATLEAVIADARRRLGPRRRPGPGPVAQTLTAECLAG
jgi:hypothetical protein